MNFDSFRNFDMPEKVETLYDIEAVISEVVCSDEREDRTLMTVEKMEKASFPKIYLKKPMKGATRTEQKYYFANDVRSLLKVSTKVYCIQRNKSILIPYANEWLRKMFKGKRNLRLCEEAISTVFQHCFEGKQSYIISTIMGGLELIMDYSPEVLCGWQGRIVENRRLNIRTESFKRLSQDLKRYAMLLCGTYK